MDNLRCLQAPWSLFDDIPTIFVASGFQTVEKRRESIVRGVRRHDLAELEVTDGYSLVTVWLERRLGNKKISIAVFPKGKPSPRTSDDSDRLADRIVSLLITHGAFDTVE